MRYTLITIEQMRQLLRSEKGWYEPNHSGHEFVFEYKVPFWDGAVVKVYTSINKHDGQGRRLGGDAIRVVAADLITKQGLHKAVRVFRVEGWRDNLKNAVEKVLRNLHKRRPRVVAPLDPPSVDEDELDDREPDYAAMAEEQALGLAYRRLDGTLLPWER